QDGKSFLESGYMADSHFFSVFAFPFLVGDAASALDDPASLVITESLAKKMFGDTNPLGQEIRYQDETSLKITGIVKDLPSTSSLQFSFISTLESSARYQREMARDKWYNSSCHTFFTLAQDADPSLLEGKLADLLDRNAPLPGEASLFIQSIHELHFAQMNADLGVKGNPQYVRLFSLVALLILSLASINYINLAVARTMKRAKEVGMRKVVGATRRQLIGQFLGESVLITMVAFLLALLLVGYLSPLFGHLISRPLTLNLDENLHILPILVGLVLVVGVLSGSYPALWISAFQPLGALQGRLKGGSGGMRLHRWFMVGQFAVSVALIFGSIVIYRQFEFIQSKELGYDKEQVITVSVQDDRLSKEFEAIRTQCLENPRIQSMTASWHLPTNITSSTVINDDDNFDDNDLTIYESRVTYDYLEVFGMQLLAGRFFSPAYATDFDQGYVLNETAAKALGWSPEEAIGKQFTHEGTETVIGVIKDFHMHSMQLAINPLMLRLAGAGSSWFSVKVRPEQLPETLEYLEEVISGHTAYPFEYAFLDQQFSELYLADVRIGQLFGGLTLISLLIASVGLFGLAALASKRRTKEMGIRKVFGASVRHLTGLLSLDFLKLILIASFVAAPFAWFVMHLWLLDFAYRITLDWWMLPLAGLSTLLIALVTVSSQSIKAAMTNPIACLKDE
ncbi:MAG: FtsX-like permease family protein, partial [Bacteroidota bacterium]